MKKNTRVVLGAVVLAVVGAGIWWKISRDQASVPDQQATVAKAAADPHASPVRDRDTLQPASIEGLVTAPGPLDARAWVLAEPIGDQPEDADFGEDDLARQTDERGRFKFERLPPGLYRLTAGAANYSPSDAQTLTLAAGEARHDITLTLGAAAPTLRGVVSDLTGGPIASALVEVTPLHGALSLAGDHTIGIRTDDEGRYRVALVPGRYRVNASHAAYVGASARIELGQAEKTLDLALAPGATIEGTVVTTAGAGVPFSIVRYSGESMEHTRGLSAGRGAGGTTTADGAGRFRLRGLRSGPVSLVAQAANAVSREPVTVSLGIAESVSEVILVVEDGYRISGRVVERKGVMAATSLAGLTVRAMSPSGTGASATTEADGTFFLRGLAPGRYRLMASGPNHLPLGFGESAELEASDLDGIVLEVTRGVRISGRVDPAAVADVSIDLLPPEAIAAEADRGEDKGPSGLGAMRMLGAGSSVKSKPDGSFELGPVLPETIYLTARDSDGKSGRAKVEVGAEGAKGVIITLEAKRTISGVVRDSARQPIANATVVIKAPQPKNRSVTMIVNGRDVGAHRAPTGADGSFRMSGIEPGVYDLSVLDPHGQRVELVAGSKKRAPSQVADASRKDAEGVVLTIDPLDGVLRGIVVGTDGRPARDAWVSASPSLPNGLGALGEIMNAADRGAPAGAPAAGGDGEASGDESQAPGGERHERVSTMVMVTDDDGGEGDAFGGGLGGALPPVLTDAEGRFELRNLRRGDYDLVAQDTKGTARAFARGVATGKDSELRLIALTRLEGTVSLDGAAVSKYTVTIDGPVMRRQTVRSDKGHYSIPRLDPGRYQVRIESSEGDGATTVDIRAGQVATADVALTRLVPVTGTIIDKDGKAVAGLMIVLGGGEPGQLSIMIEDDGEPARTDAQGRFRIGAAPGKHVLVALDESTEGPRLVHPFEVRDERSMNLGELSTR